MNFFNRSRNLKDTGKIYNKYYSETYEEEVIKKEECKTRRYKNQ